MKETVFQFNIEPKKPQYHISKINLNKAYIKNIIRYIFINKIRYIKRYLAYLKLKKQYKNLRKCTIEELSMITSICRPGKMELNIQEKLILKNKIKDDKLT